MSNQTKYQEWKDDGSLFYKEDVSMKFCTFENVDFCICINNEFLVSIQFELLNINRTFTFNNWTAYEFQGFANRFFDHKDRDSQVFGLMDIQYKGGCERASNMMIQSAKDVISTISSIIIEQIMVYNYAKWYIVNVDYNVGNYKTYITGIACKCIVDTKFMAMEDAFFITEFKE